MRRLAVVVIAVFVAATSASGTRAAVWAPEALQRPDAVGDQLIYYYDARSNFTSYLTLLNSGPGELTVSVLFYGPTFSTPFSQAVTLASGALRILDVGALRASGLPAQPGAAFATAVNVGGQPIATGWLSGNFTVANLATNSAWGAHAMARSAVRPDGSAASPGTVVDGMDAAFKPIRPFALDLAAYYNPNDLAPVSASGNQVIFITFEDSPGATFSAEIGSTTWNVVATRNTGVPISDTAFTANGVTVSDLASVAGAGVNGASGSLRFVSSSNNVRLSRMIFFAETLGTFGTGYMLPPAPGLF